MQVLTFFFSSSDAEPICSAMEAIIADDMPDCQAYIKGQYNYQIPGKKNDGQLGAGELTGGRCEFFVSDDVSLTTVLTALTEHRINTFSIPNSSNLRLRAETSK